MLKKSLCLSTFEIAILLTSVDIAGIKDITLKNIDIIAVVNIDAK